MTTSLGHTGKLELLLRSFWPTDRAESRTLPDVEIINVYPEQPVCFTGGGFKRVRDRAMDLLKNDHVIPVVTAEDITSRILDLAVRRGQEMGRRALLHHSLLP